MGDAPVGHRAANLPWLCPAGASLLALSDEWPDARLLAADPAAVLLLLRYTRPTPPPDDFRLDVEAFSESIITDATARYLGATTDGRLEPTHSTTAELLRFALLTSKVSAELAAQTRTAPPAAAAAAALLAALGWFLITAVDQRASSDCLDAIRDGERPTDAQTRLWGLTHDGIIRRAAGRWRLPAWLTAVIGHLGLPTDVAVRLGAPRGLFTVVQTAVTACEQNLVTFGITRGDAKSADRKLLQLTQRLIDTGHRQRSSSSDLEEMGSSVPIPFLVKLLRTAARARRAEAVGRIERLHAEIDCTIERLRVEGEQFEARVRDAKLTALAELAAGAGHEINNPLAVISGNAQLLLGRASDGESQKALDSIIRQSRRISEIVNDLMQFARPRPPTPRRFDMAGMVNQVIEEYRPIAFAKQVDLMGTGPAEPVGLFADPGQLGRVLALMVRNGIEAARSGGWVHIVVESQSDRVAVIVEDSGPGPAGPVIEHMFDPFYSGRTAGRGRGLGLPTAWRLARENGGIVRYEPIDGGPTRFVLELPKSSQSVEHLTERKSA